MALQNEMQEITQMVSDVQQRLVKVSKRCEERDNEKLKQLEEDNSRLRKGVKHLGVTNAELERKVKAHKPELSRAIDARDAAFNKLRHARRVIKDLIEEKEKGEPNERPIVSPTFSTLDILSTMSPSSTSSRSSLSSQKTVRGNSHEKAIQPPGSPQSTRSTKRQDARVPLSPQTSTVVGEQRSSADLGSPPKSPKAEEQKWSIYFHRLPKAAKVCKGPYSWDDLQQIFGLKDEIITSLQSLQSLGDLSMRVYTLQNIAFVYDPVFLDSGENSYFIDWGRKQVNEGIIDHFKDPGQSVYYTFVFPKFKNMWYFIGAFTWTVANDWLIWPTLGRKSREEIVKNLKGRCCEPDVNTVEELISSGKAEQICVLMDVRSGHDELTRQFAAQLGMALKSGRQRGGSDTTPSSS
ncbi:hypothetical protein M378DRAFT_156280 [Amanita muscaria Koide BX008]|uniref:Uncharacterized protein n=1 Tax=Amanita muscaria (strain Koide BX008) TaxID=946122 RepID=A0A0C2T2W0_AMAMK|nr:hypothetical protein M378DRAFT_156280 [Amanita muscaria Koide BX008]